MRAPLSRAETMFQAMGCLIIGIIMLVVGIVLLKRKSVLKGTAGGTIVNTPTCMAHFVSGSNRRSATLNWACTNMSVEYIVNGVEYHKVINTDSVVPYAMGSTMTIYFDPNNPTNASNSSDDGHLIGAIMACVGLVMVLGSGYAIRNP